MKNIFEKGLWFSRYIVILTVVLSILSSFSLIAIASWDIVEAIFIDNPMFKSEIDNNNQFLFKIISLLETISNRTSISIRSRSIKKN